MKKQRLTMFVKNARGEGEWQTITAMAPLTGNKAQDAALLGASVACELRKAGIAPETVATWGEQYEVVKP